MHPEEKALNSKIPKITNIKKSLIFPTAPFHHFYHWWYILSLKINKKNGSS